MIGIIAAMNCELDYLLAKIENKKEIKIQNFVFYQGDINQREVVIGLCGIGKVNASILTTLMLNNFSIDWLINTGIAGGISPLKTNDLVIGDKFIYHDFDLRAFHYEIGQVPKLPQYFHSDFYCKKKMIEILNKLSIIYKEVKILTGDKFLSTVNLLDDTFFDEHYIAIDMEGAAIAQTCFLFNIPFISIRIISDILDTNEHIKNYFEFEQKAGELSASILYQVIYNNI